MSIIINNYTDASHPTEPFVSSDSISKSSAKSSLFVANRGVSD